MSVCCRIIQNTPPKTTAFKKMLLFRNNAKRYLSSSCPHVNRALTVFLQFDLLALNTRNGIFIKYLLSYYISVWEDRCFKYFCRVQMFLKSTDLPVQSSPLKVCFAFPCRFKTFSWWKRGKERSVLGLDGKFLCHIIYITKEEGPRSLESTWLWGLAAE